MRGGFAGRSLTVAVLMLASRVDAHDSWLIAERNVNDACGTVRVAFVTSEHFPKSEHATGPERVAEWTVVGAGGRQVVSKYAIEDNELVANPQIGPQGLFAVGVALRPHPIELAYDKFEHYLTDEQSESALRTLRARSGTAIAPQRERYTKFAKTFVEVQPQTDSASALPPLVGHSLEIQPTSDPCLWSAGREVEVQVLLDGQPAPHTRVSSGREGLDGHSYVETVKADSCGMARLKLDRPGLWFVRTHFIRPTDGEAAKDAEWESWWASITFRVAEQPPTAIILDEVKAIHGAAGPWAVAGYRLGLRALNELGLKRGSFDLEVIHETPMQVQYSCVADGIQAATGASAGKLNLRLKEAKPDEMRTVFRRRSTGQTCVIMLTDRARTRMMDVPYDQAVAVGRTIAGLPDDVLMRVTRAEETCHATTQAARPGGSRE